MSRLPAFVRLAGIAFAIASSALPALQGADLPPSGLAGVVKSQDGKAMEGVAVSAQGQRKTFITSVYTNRSGEYYFPPLENGQYKIWAQAIGFAPSRAEQSVVPGKKIQQNFTLKPIEVFHKQLSGTEWADSLPADSPEDRRMRDVLHNECTSCHETGFVLQKRFDEAGWRIIMRTMINEKTVPGSPDRGLLEAYQDDLVTYLAKIRGPRPYPIRWQPLPRVSGESTQVVVTEYQIPPGDQPDTYFLSQNGSNWSDGILGKAEGYVLHDSVVGPDGFVYFSDPQTPERTMGRLDPKTGTVKTFKLLDDNGYATSTHGAGVDLRGNIWFTNQTDRQMLEFDPRLEVFRRFPWPDQVGPKKPTSGAIEGRGAGGVGRVVNAIEVDSKGNLWTPASDGAARLNPESGVYTQYKSITKGGSIYGIAVDAEDKAWIAQLGADRLMVADGRTGEVSEVALPPVEGVGEKDREIAARVGSGTNAGALTMKGPRRLGADKNGNAVWVAEYWSGQLAKIDIHTKKVTEYKVPSRYSHPYDIVVDKNHMVWICLLNSDRIAKFDPFTERFTEYPLPTLGTNVRFIDVDNSGEVPAVWLPYSGMNKIARVEFRTRTTSNAPKQVARNGR